MAFGRPFEKVITIFGYNILVPKARLPIQGASQDLFPLSTQSVNTGSGLWPP